MLVGRQLFGIVLSLIGMLVTTRLLGPEKYGQFAIVYGLIQYASNVGRFGLDTYLIRYQGNLKPQQIGVTQGLYLIIGLGTALATFCGGPLASSWYADPSLKDLFWSFACIIPFIVLTNVPIAVLDRHMDYKKAALTELAGQLTYLCISVPIVWYSRSIWGLVLAVFGQTFLVLALASFWSKVRFRPSFHRQEAKEQLHYGASYAASMWIWQIRDLVNPLVVGKLLGPESVAFVAMAIRLVGLVGFAKTAVWRVYMSFLARISHDREKMKAAVETGLSHQVLILGVTFIVFTALSPELIKGFMGERWLPLLKVLPFITAGMIVNSGFSLHASALYVIGKNNAVTLFHIIHVTLFVTAAWFFVSTMGTIIGYGCAEMAALVSYFSIRRALHRNLFAIKERLLYLNIIFVIGSIATIASLPQSALVLRSLAALTALSLLLLAAAKNREATMVIWDKVSARLRLRAV